LPTTRSTRKADEIRAAWDGVIQLIGEANAAGASHVSACGEEISEIVYCFIDHISCCNSISARQAKFSKELICGF